MLHRNRLTLRYRLMASEETEPQSALVFRRTVSCLDRAWGETAGTEQDHASNRFRRESTGMKSAERPPSW